jgi:peptidoglycan biosynthesis protein MviN/MurJ (putative lipid II flippase)
LVVAFATIEPWGMPGLALANAVQNSAHAVVLYALLARTLPTLRQPSHLGFLGAIAICAAGGAALTWLAGGWLSPALESASALIRLVVLGLASGLGVAMYAGLLVVFRVPEALAVTRLLRRAFRF